MPPVPTVGRSVHYKSRGSLDGVFPPTNRAAIITDVRKVEDHPDGTYKFPAESGPIRYQCRLFIMNPEGTFFSDWLEEGQNPGNWSWPQIV